MFIAASVRKYLRRQHTIQSDIFHGRPAARQLWTPTSPCSLSNGFTKVATSGPGRQLLVHDLAGDLWCKWTLPEPSAALQPASEWGWDPAGQRLGLPMSRSTASGTEFGLMFIKVFTGDCQGLFLQPKVQPVSAKAHFSPRQALVLLQLVSSQASQLLAVLDFDGTCIANVEQPTTGLQGLQCHWSPAHYALAIHGTPAADLAARTLLWLLSGPIAEVAVTICPLAWSQNAESTLAMSADRHVVFADLLPSKVSSKTVPVPDEVKGEPCCLGWGRQLAVLTSLATEAPWSCDQVHLLAVQDDCLTVQHTVTAGRRLFAPHMLQVSGDGELCAGITGSPNWGKLTNRYLAVVHLASGRLREYALTDMHLADRLDTQHLRVRWSPGAVALRVLSEDGVHNEVFRFAE